jgi:hypothetical protein
LSIYFLKEFNASKAEVKPKHCSLQFKFFKKVKILSQTYPQIRADGIQPSLICTVDASDQNIHCSLNQRYRPAHMEDYRGLSGCGRHGSIVILDWFSKQI